MRALNRMPLPEIIKTLKAKVIAGAAYTDMEISWAYCADLMSDVLSFSVTDSLLITHLTNAQVVRTAEVANMRAIVFVEGKRPDAETAALAESKKIPLIVSPLTMFDACGMLFGVGLKGKIGDEV